MSNSFNSHITEKFKFIKISKTSDGIDIVEIKSEQLAELTTYLKIFKDTRFDMLFSVSGVDRPELCCFEVVYHLFSTAFKKHLMIKVLINRQNPEIESISGIYSAAEWHERETFDLFGIKFKNHPNLTRILMPNDWRGHPLRKDYVNDDERLIWNKR
jgi:NADH-quinone oxidoreductase subunit C